MKIGRNDPCHCGSGKKYKYCHYDVDREAESAARKEAMEAQTNDGPESDESGTDSADTREERHTKGGSRFFRDTKRSTTKGQNGTSDGRVPRTTRGAQRGG